MIGCEVERGRLLDLGSPEDLDDADERDQYGVLLEADEVIEQGWDDPPDRLRQDHVAHRLEPAQAQGAGRGVLARVDRFDAGSVDLRHVCRIDEGERDDRPEERLVRDPRDPESGDAEPQDVDDDEPGHGPEDVDVGGRQTPDREEDRTRQTPQDREQEPERQDECLGDEEQLDVRPERGDQAGQARPEQRPIEEVRLDLGPVRGVDDDPPQPADHDDRADQRDGGRPPRDGRSPPPDERRPPGDYRRASRSGHPSASATA